MAATLASSMKVYDPRTQGAYRERNAQVIEAFNAASSDTIKLSSASAPANYDIEAFFRRETQAALIARRDTTSLSAQTDTNVTQDEKVAVKLNRKIKPYSVTADAMRKIGQSVKPGDNPEDAVMFALGGAVADTVAEEKLNTALAAYVAAIGAQAAAVSDQSAVASGVTSSKLNTALYKRGDRAVDIKAWIMHSSKYAQLIDNQLSTNATGIASVVLTGGTPLSFNRPILVTDSPSLVLDTTTDLYYTLGLTEDAIEIEDTEEELIVGQWVTGLENLVMRMQGEYAYNLGLMGFTWDVTNGGANPSSGALTTATNWDMCVQSSKSLGGVMLITQ